LARFRQRKLSVNIKNYQALAVKFNLSSNDRMGRSNLMGQPLVMNLLTIFKIAGIR
jgi:hypothetical protein